MQLSKKLPFIFAVILTSSCLISCQSTEDDFPQPKTVNETNLFLFPEDPPSDNDGNSPGGSGGGSGPINPYFASSEGTPSHYNSYPSGAYNGPDNPNGYIVDIKIMEGDNSYTPNNASPDAIKPLDGYFVLPINLNEGAGGRYIYFTFTRNPSKVQGPQKYKGPVRGIYVYQYGEDEKGFINNYDIVTRPGVSFPYYQSTWFDANLNAGGIGRGNIKVLTQRAEATGGPIEISVIRGSSDQIQPPSGWQKFDFDLNKGIGGDYIYLCYKRI